MSAQLWLNFQPLEVVGRGSETQLQVAENCYIFAGAELSRSDIKRTIVPCMGELTNHIV